MAVQGIPDNFPVPDLPAWTRQLGGQIDAEIDSDVRDMIGQGVFAALWPVGTVVVNNNDPAGWLGGTWERYGWAPGPITTLDPAQNVNMGNILGYVGGGISTDGIYAHWQMTLRATQPVAANQVVNVFQAASRLFPVRTAITTWWPHTFYMARSGWCQLATGADLQPGHDMEFDILYMLDGPAIQSMGIAVRQWRRTA